MQHIGIFCSDTVKIICLRGDINAFFIVLCIGCGVKECKLKLDSAVKVVEEITPTLKYGGLVLVLCNLIIDVTELQSFGVELITYMTNAIGKDMTVRDTVLCRFNTFWLIICLLNRLLDALFF